MPKDADQEPNGDAADLREQFRISLAQIRAGEGLTAEESLADLERDEAACVTDNDVSETENEQNRQERELQRHLQTSYAQALAGDVLTEEESLARIDRIESAGAKYVVCLRGGSDLVAGKKYRVISDPELEVSGLIRVVDESGEDYVYLTRRFRLDP